ncbi:MAG: hypothetical protein AUH81_14520 [Candidatus Rokubacteria bacterium 13_1_40CM_4_69_5]|nr:MAG: hypothetical protein AUH81_14520 [Candidatus Rokubacteria bacterium 13_1_40CM_4_69_5]
MGVAISLALLALLLASVDLRELGEQLRRTRWGWTLLAATLGPIGLWVRAQRWRYLFPPRSDPPGLVPAMMIGYMANNLLPLRAGEVVRVYVVARRWRRGFWTTLATLIVERVLDSLVLVLVLAVLVLLIPVPPVFQWTAVALLAIDFGAMAVLGFLAAAPGTCRRLLERLTRRWPRVERRVAGIFETFARGLEGIRTRHHLLPLLVWTVIVWVVPALTVWTMLQAVNLDLPWIAAWTVLVFVGLGISIPSAPGYVGVFHYAVVLALGIFDVPRPASLGYAIVLHASQIVPVTLVGWIFMLREHLSLGEATRARPAGADLSSPR